jgi:hypothetical protein
MAVYEHTYKSYDSALTPQWSRFLVLPRHAFRAVFQSKLFTGLFALCFVAPLIFAILIYLRHNSTALALMQLQPSNLVAINGDFFFILISIQSGLAFLLTVIIGPALVSRDLANNALPLYLCRPFSRAEYVLGKASVLVILLSLVTLVPAMLLFIFQSYLEGFVWLKEYYWIANAIFDAFLARALGLDQMARRGERGALCDLYHSDGDRDLHQRALPDAVATSLQPEHAAKNCQRIALSLHDGNASLDELADQRGMDRDRRSDRHQSLPALAQSARL